MALPENWQPQFNEIQTRRLLKQYEGSAHKLNEEQQKQLKEHAEAYNLPHYDGDFSLLDAIGQAGAGFIEGFTTLNISDHPDNEYEQIFRNLGHLAGFAPGIMSKPAMLLGKTALGKAIGARTFAKAASQLKSIPMRGADFLQKHAKQSIKTMGKSVVGRSQAVDTAKNFIMGNKARHIVEGAFHLGAASSISAWQGGVDEMIQAGMGGALAGGIFRTIGNLSPGTKTHEKVGKAIAGSLFMGLPSTVRGDTTPEQIYEYAMGAYFGGNEVSWTRAKSMKAMKAIGEKAEKDPKWAATSGMDPELWEGYKNLPEEVKPLLKKEAAKAWGDPEVNKIGAMPFEILKELGLEGKISEADLVEKGFKATGEYKDGDQIYKLDPAVVKEKFKAYVISGGAEGADTAFAKQADAVGLPAIHYTFGGHAKGIKATGFQRVLTTPELEEADSRVSQANNNLGRNPTKKEYTKNLQRRNWYQIKYADSAYAVGEFQKKGNQKDYKTGNVKYIKESTQVKGATGLTVQMAIDKKIPVFFYEQVEKQWYKWNKGANSEFGMFTQIKSPPKPTNRFAGIGTRNINPAGKQAIKTLFQSNWKTLDTATKKASETAKDEAKIKKQKDLDKQIEETGQIIKEINDELTIDKAAGVDTALKENLLTETIDKQSDFVKRRNALTAPPVDGVKPESLNKETVESEIADRANTDFEGATDLEIGKRSLQFTTKHLNELISGGLTEFDAQNKKFEISELVEQVLVKTEDGTPIAQGGVPRYLRRNSKENLSEEWANDLQNTIREVYGNEKFELKPEARLELRQWMTRKNMGNLVSHLQSDGSTVNTMVNPNNPISKAGNRKIQEEPIKEIELAYARKGGKTDEPVYMVLDHVTIEGKDLTLSAYRNYHLLKENKYDADVAKIEYDKFVGNAMKKMAEKGYYAFGGSSDKDRMIWMKHNPEVQNMSKAEVILKHKDIANLNTNSDFKKHLDLSRTEFLQKYKMTSSEFDKIWLSNLYYDLHINGMEVNNANIKTILTHPGFIKNSAAFNKRQQIWMNNAWAGDVEFVKKQGVKLTDVINKETGEVQENYSYLIVKDLADAAKKLDHRTVGLKNSELPENVDGAIIVSNKVLDAINADFGNPKSGQNKSFIVSPNGEKGALLGKYMMHAAGEKMSKLMDAKGLHMIMQESAVKQEGLRKIGDYDIKNGKLEINGEIYNDLAPEHVKGNFGVYGNTHMIENQRIPKQMLQNLLPTAWKEIKSETIEDVFDNVIRKRWDGDIATNEKLEKFIKLSESNELSSKDLISFETDIINNIDKIGVKQLVEAMKNESTPGLSEAIYNKMLKIEKNEIMTRFNEGELTPEELSQQQSEILEFNTLTDRVIRVAGNWAKSQRDQGVDANISSVYMHKFIRDFRIKAVQNFILNSATKPVRENSASGFMRPYDKAMRQDLDKANPRLKELETNDEIFFLDNAFKEVKVNVELTGKQSKITRTTLGNLWDLYNRTDLSKSNKEYIENVFEAATVRTPMDSMSGAQILKFAGFTGRDGHGILLHARAMRAEGGADLDGDKSSIFFGGKNGFSKSWKKAYKDNKKEFYFTEDGVEKVSDNKKATVPGTNISYRQLLANNPNKKEREYLTSKVSQYSPTERIRISEAAVNGRNQLGPAVVNKQVMSAAYSAILANGGKDEFEVKIGFGKDAKNYVINVEAKTDATSKEKQRGMGRAQVGLASDPLDELGLKGNALWFKELWTSHFKINSVKETNYKGKKTKLLKKDEMDKIFNGNILESPSIRGGVLGNLAQVNKAYWGKNHSEGRKFNMNEILDLGGAIEDIPLKAKETSFLARTGELLNGLNWSDSVFGKINPERLRKVYSEHLERVDSFNWLKELLGRPSFKVDKNAYIENVLTHKLWTINGLNNAANSKANFLKAIKGTMFETRVKENMDKYFTVKQKNNKNQSITLGGDVKKLARRNLLAELKEMAEDYVINDVTDLSSLTEISKEIELMKINKETGFKEGTKSLEQGIARIHNEVDRLKKNSYLMARDRRNVVALLEEGKQLVPKEQQDAWAILEADYNTALKISKKKKAPKSSADRPTAEMDQNAINNAIELFKKDLTQSGVNLFDQLMLGSINRGNMAAIEKFEQGIKKPDRFTMQVLKGLRAEASKTRVSRLGFSSNVISDKAVEKHIGSFASNFKEGHRPLTETDLNKLDVEIDNYKSRVEDDGIDPALIEAFLPSGYGGIKKGKLDVESKSIVAEIVDIMKEMNNKDSRDVNGLMRGVVGKDLNAMNKNDFKIFRNWLNDVRRGNFIQRMFHKKGPVELNKRHWALFPKAVNRELMRDDLVMMKQWGAFTDKLGVEQQGLITRPTHYIDIVQNFIGKMNDSAINVSDKYIKRFNESMLFHSGLEDSQKLWEIAVRQREAHWTEIERIQKSDKDPEVKQRAIDELHKNYTSVKKANNWAELEGKSYTVTLDNVRQKLTGGEIVNRINRELTSLFKEMHTFITGKEGALDAYKYPAAKNDVEYDYKKFVRHLQEHVSGRSPKGWVKEGIATDVPSYFGIDGLRKIARSMQVDMIKGDKKVRAEIAAQDVENTGQLSPDAYFPHMFFDKSVSKKMMKEAIKKIVGKPESEMTKADKEKELKKLYYKNKSLGGEMRFEEMEEWDLVDSVIQDIAKNKKISEDRIKWFNANERAGSMKSRDIHMGSWSIDPVSVESYVRSLSNTYHRQLNQMFGREQVQNMYGQMIGKWGQEQTVAWQNFMKLYIQDAIGNPSVIPQYMLDNPNMKLKGTPYASWSDSNVRDRINKFGKALGLGDKKLPEELRGVSVEDLRNWSNLEAQYNMATLLAHPKSMALNVFGGAVHTVESAGMPNFLKARNPEYLSKINPEWKTMQDVDNFVVSQGVIPEYLVYEFGLQKEFQSTKGKKFVQDLTAKLTRDPSMSEKTIGEIANNYGLKDKAMNFASKFMSAPEKMLRRDAFMAHYVQAWEKYGSVMKEYDNPFLVEIAKKGVKATQFLYNAPYRPAFARTSLGKFMSRFQLWAYNSVRFRNDIRRQARIYGFKPGTEQWARFERTMQTDLVTFALSNVFAYSMFEQALPQPWGWFQDTADWVFGDEKERDRAFYGAWPTAVAPLQAVTPPGLRLVGPTFDAILSDDWSKMSQYYGYTMLPFGRIIRDVNPYADNNLITNPSRFMEKMLGVPKLTLQRNITNWKDREVEDAEGNITIEKGDKPKQTYATGPLNFG